MKIFFTFISILLISTLSCLEPERDNPYDPNNPGKVDLGGTVYGINYHSIDGATIKLIQDTIVVKETQSEVTGRYELTDDTFDGGSIGLWVKSWEMGGVATAHFDDMGIWP